MRKRWLFGIPVALVAAGAAIGYVWWTKPYELPPVDPGVRWEQYGMQFDAEARVQQSGEWRTGRSDDAVEMLKEAVVSYPDNMAYSNALRIAMASRDEHEAFIAYVEAYDDDSPRLQLQKALAYVDLLQDPDLGTASLGQISSRSIHAANELLRDNPYDLLAHYARGLNNLYWPSGLRRTEKAIQDLAYCLAVAKQWEDTHESSLWPLIYTAYGDALVKEGRVREGIAVWKDGTAKYAGDRALAERAALSRDEALERVRQERGIDTFQRPDPAITDLSILWTTAN